MFAILSICVMLFQPMLASAKCGGVDYSWGADALSNAHDFTVTMMTLNLYFIENQKLSILKYFIILFYSQIYIILSLLL